MSFLSSGTAGSVTADSWSFHRNQSSILDLSFPVIPVRLSLHSRLSFFLFPFLVLLFLYYSLACYSSSSLSILSSLFRSSYCVVLPVLLFYVSVLLLPSILTFVLPSRRLLSFILLIIPHFIGVLLCQIFVYRHLSFPRSSLRHFLLIFIVNPLSVVRFILILSFLPFVILSFLHSFIPLLLSSYTSFIFSFLHSSLPLSCHSSLPSLPPSCFPHFTASQH